MVNDGWSGNFWRHHIYRGVGRSHTPRHLALETNPEIVTRMVDNLVTQPAYTKSI